MSAGRRPEGRERAGLGRPRRSGGQPGSGAGSAPPVGAMHRRVRLTPRAGGDYSRDRQSAPRARPSGPRPRPPSPLLPRRAAPGQPSLSVHTEHTYIYGAGDRLTFSATPSGSRLKLTRPCHERRPLVH